MTEGVSGVLKAIAEATGCMTCEETGEAVLHYDHDMNPDEFGPCPDCLRVAKAAGVA